MLPVMAGISWGVVCARGYNGTNTEPFDKPEHWPATSDEEWASTSVRSWAHLGRNDEEKWRLECIAETLGFPRCGEDIEFASRRYQAERRASSSMNKTAIEERIIDFSSLQAVSSYPPGIY
jgi:hypothetical protein